MTQKIHKVKYGKTERQSFSQVKETLDIPYFIALQKDSYEYFRNYGIQEVLDAISPIEEDLGGKTKLYFLKGHLEDKPKHTIKECKDMDLTYSVPLKVNARLERENGEIIESEVFMGDIPLMTDSGSFIINGAERVIVSQIVRSPGIYGNEAVDKNGTYRYGVTVIPNRGAWLEFKEDIGDLLWVNVDKNKKVTSTMLLRALGFGKNEEIMEIFGDDPIIANTIAKDDDKAKASGEENLWNSNGASERAKLELYKKLRPGEIPNYENLSKQINNMFFDEKRYDLANVGRYKFNKKLALGYRARGLKLVEDAVSEDGEIIAKKGVVLDEEKAWEIQNAGINVIYVEKQDGTPFKMIGNETVDFKAVTGLDPKDFGLMKIVDYKTLKSIMDTTQDEADRAVLYKANVNSLVYMHITIEDIIAVINYNLGLIYGLGSVDNIDHLGNRRVRAIGELLQNQLRTGLNRLERTIKDKMKTTQEDVSITPKNLINVKPVTSIIKQFFCSSQLSQFMEQPNPIAELTHKRKLSALGRGGLTRERANFEVRDINYTHYGRICPIETPEGQNIGLISSLSTYARVNEYGFLESPYRKVDKKTRKVTTEVCYLDADDEDRYIIAQANEPLNEDGSFVNERVTCRQKENIKEFDTSVVDFMDVSPKQLISVAASLIPFLENDDTARALMGSNMQRQAVPLLNTEAPLIATGIEHKIACDSGILVIAEKSGTVCYVDAQTILVDNDDKTKSTYLLKKFDRSNQDTCINQRPIVSTGDYVKAGDVIADGPATSNGELALGKNMLIAFMTWEGYNFEDAILISEDLVKDDVFTSVHIKKYEVEARDNSKIGNEEITRDIPNLPLDASKNLDEDGIVYVGAEVKSGDILVGKITPKGQTEDSVTEKFIKELFGKKSVEEVRNSSLKLPHGESGVVVDVKVYTRENKDELAPGVSKKVRVYVAQKRKISVGDKMAGRHGNKGVVSRVLPKEDMPFLEDGTPVQIVLNPLGVPSRMNIGQVLEVHLGLAAKTLGFKVETPVFDGANENDIRDLLVQAKLPEDGKIQLYDGRTGEKFENKVTVGYMYYLKLNHLVDDKIHARSIGPYSAITQQPLGGKAQFGGQRFGEMEVWALEAYGASNILQEMLTVKSDDVKGRPKSYKSILKGQNFSEPGIPEAFKVLIKELQSLSLDVRLLTEEREEIALKDFSQDDMDIMPLRPISSEEEKTTVSVLQDDTSIEDLFSAFSSSEESASEIYGAGYIEDPSVFAFNEDPQFLVESLISDDSTDEDSNDAE